MVEIFELDTGKLRDFLGLLKLRGSCNTEIETIVYSNFKYYGGFIAYVDNQPAGCIGYVIKRLAYDSNKEILWFNDWFVAETYRGLDIGKKLLQKVATKSGLSCGIISPLQSRKVGLKSGFSIAERIMECRFPLNPYKVGYKKYFRGNFYSDSLIKRVVRAWKFKILSSFRRDDVSNCSFKKGPIDINLNIVKDLPTGFWHDNNFLLFVISVLESQKKNELDLWTIQHADFWSMGFTFLLRNKIKESVVLYTRILNGATNFSVYSSIINTLKINNEADQINILLDSYNVKKFKLNKCFIKELPFFVFGDNFKSVEFIQHLDKDSSWRF